MFHTILLPTDGSALADHAIATAIAFARLNHAKLIGLSVAQPLPLAPVSEGGIVFDVSVYQQQMQDAARHHVDKIGAAARAADIPFEGLVTVSASPHQDIVETAVKYNCDIILMASHGRTGLNKFFLGGETQKVLAHTTLPVMVLR